MAKKIGKIDLSQFDNIQKEANSQNEEEENNIVTNPITLKNPNTLNIKNNSIISDGIIYHKNEYIGPAFRTTKQNHSMLKLMAEVDHVNISDVGNAIIDYFFRENKTVIKEKYKEIMNSRFDF